MATGRSISLLQGVGLLLHPRTVKAFVKKGFELISHHSSTVTPYIGRSIIDEARDQLEHADLFQSCLPCFNRLRTLQSQNVKWLDYVMNVPDNLVSAFERTKNLRLWKCTFDHPLHLKSAIARFRSLKRLSVSHSRFLDLSHSEQHPAADRHPQPLKLPDLDALELWEDNHSQSMNWFPFEDVSIVLSTSISSKYRSLSSPFDFGRFPSFFL